MAILVLGVGLGPCCVELHYRIVLVTLSKTRKRCVKNVFVALTVIHISYTGDRAIFV